MKFVSRAQWGARPSRYALAYIGSTRGVKIHYEGSPVPASLARPENHGQCAGRVRAIQASHLANREEDYSDIAYSAMVCPHGYVYEGRGAHRRTGANGSAALNTGHYAVCAMVGDEGLTTPTDAQLDGLRDAIEWLREDGDAGNEIRGHKDGYATACPGPALYAWVQRGAPRPSGGGGTPSPQFEPFPGVAWFKRAPRSPIVTAMGRRLVAEGCSAYREGPGPQWTESDRQSYARWQRKLGFSGDDADGWPGATSWAALKVPKS
ncbi:MULTISPECIES: peptidoglycan-binding protein [unclassified Streptomyces]|uniref:peptidoglycan-binding protein n=1 Tax=unclassified Streptomyces TaxID=2593676 RepID=UPI0006AD87F3|nr:MULTISPECIES: peptidoglycan-binding protein [unclassified Streptomyces]KOX16578.1 N-acetylmuramoyl-L-alanine amidase [Streptomyces sp. NRRL F-6491]KOX36095.1 N-acetylmuramoyl-L-alanine amidase [Streptomyces sp. NRRL F-6492]